MAFFGLTALGPQNSWAELIRGSFVVEVFSDEEFTAAFDYMAVDGKLSGEADLTKTLERVYHGDVPDDELASFLAAVPREEDGTITKESLMAGVIDMRAQAADFFFDWKQKTSGACDFRSVNLMREHHLRNQLFHYRLVIEQQHLMLHQIKYLFEKQLTKHTLRLKLVG